MTRNIFVVGHDAFNVERLKNIDVGEPFRVHSLLAFDEVKDQDAFDFDRLLARARRRLRDFGGRVDAIIGWWDFPTTSLVPLLCDAQGLPHPPLESVLACEHKYWSRLVQREAVPECVPPFELVDPFAPDADRLTFDWPVWIKPVKSFSSNLGFRCGSAAEYRRALTAILANIDRLGAPFDSALAHVDAPPEVRGGGRHCVVEKLVGGRQCTLEGYVQNGRVVPYAIIDSVRYPNRSSFQRYQYPSSLPRRVQSRICRAATTLVRALGYDNGAFNVEFFWNSKDDALWIVEINPRLSQSHSDIFEKVHGVSHFQILVDIALGRPVRWDADHGRYRHAAKFFVRAFTDGVVTRAPDAADLERLHAEFPNVEVELSVETGTRLSELHDQDSYSFDLAQVFVGADSQAELLGAYRQALDRLPLQLAHEVDVVDDLRGAAGALPAQKRSGGLRDPGSEIAAKRVSGNPSAS